MENYQEESAAKKKSKTLMYVGIGMSVMLMFSICCCCGLRFSSQQKQQKAEKAKAEAVQLKRGTDIWDKAFNSPRTKVGECAKSDDSKACNTCCSKNKFIGSTYFGGDSCECFNLN